MSRPDFLIGVTSKPANNVELVYVTPPLAETFLERNPVEDLGDGAKNRKASEHKVAMWSKVMREGNWILTHQGVAFDEQGRLMDGQHRLRAIVQTGMAQWMYVFWDIKRESFDRMDVGWKRNAQQMMSGANAKVIAPAARNLLRIETLGENPGRGIRMQHSTDHDIMGAIERWPELDVVAGYASKVYETTKINRPFHAAILAVAMRTEYSDRIDSWVDGLVTGAGLEADDPRLALRSRFMKDYKTLNNNHSADYTFGIMAKAWNAYALGRPITTLRHLEKSDLPFIVGYDYGH